MRKSVVFGLVIILVIRGAFAAQPNDQGLVPSIAKALTKAKAKNVVVFDFIGPGQNLNQLGQDIADGLRQSLVNSGGKFHVIDRAMIRDVIEKNRVTPDVVGESEIAWWLARQLGADVLVAGKLEVMDNQLDITVATAKVRDGKQFDGFSLSVPLTEEMRKQLENSLTENYATKYARLVANALSLPSCILCPRPQYPEAAIANKKEAIVVLVVLIGEDGSPKEIAIGKAGPYGFTQKAIEAVQKWKFKPGIGLDGKPQAMWAPIEASFHMH